MHIHVIVQNFPLITKACKFTETYEQINYRYDARQKTKKKRD